MQRYQGFIKNAKNTAHDKVLVQYESLLLMIYGNAMRHFK